MDSWPLASVCVQVGHGHRGHVGPGQAGPRLVPGKHLDTLAEVRAEPRVDGEVRRRLQTKSLATSNNQRHIAMRLTHPISETHRKSVIFLMFRTILLIISLTKYKYKDSVKNDQSFKSLILPSDLPNNVCTIMMPLENISFTGTVVFQRSCPSYA